MTVQNAPSAISGAPFLFLGSVADFGRSDSESVVIAYERIESHHRRVGVNVLFANGDVRLVKQGEFKKLVGQDPR